ncbi:formate dehydrogenase accessory sulfurtransferase FdhD [Arthrobacter sp. GCM10027362]
MARETGLTLAGFSRGRSINVYTHPDRVAADVRAASEAEAAPA